MIASFGWDIGDHGMNRRIKLFVDPEYQPSKVR